MNEYCGTPKYFSTLPLFSNLSCCNSHASGQKMSRVVKLSMLAGAILGVVAALSSCRSARSFQAHIEAYDPPPRLVPTPGVPGGMTVIDLPAVNP
jgi:hypothetical protein